MVIKGIEVDEKNIDIFLYHKIFDGVGSFIFEILHLVFQLFELFLVIYFVDKLSEIDVKLTLDKCWKQLLSIISFLFFMFVKRLANSIVIELT